MESTRKKGDLELSFTYSTSINPVRQKTQAVVKDNFSKIGVDVQLKQVDAGIFFDSAAGNDQSYTHFFEDLEMYTSSPGFSFPSDYAEAFYTGTDGSNLSRKSNQWSGQNLARYQNPDYDAAYDEVKATTDPERAAELFITMNDIVINDLRLHPVGPSRNRQVRDFEPAQQRQCRARPVRVELLEHPELGHGRVSLHLFRGNAPGRRDFPGGLIVCRRLTRPFAMTSLEHVRT